MRVHVWPSRLKGPVLPRAWPSKRRRRLVTETAGVLSVLLAISLVCFALDIFASYLATDFFVPDFSATAHVLVTTLNHQLALNGTGALDLVSPRAAYIASLPSAPSPAYARLLMYDELTTVQSAVRGLRQLAASRVVKMVSPYCWVDLQKRWELAYTVRRQARCARFDATNGAVHLETVLRNIKWKSFLASTQGRFLSIIGLPIAESSDEGDAWLMALQTHKWAAESDEVALWQRHGIDRFALQYGTGYDIGLSETIAIANALGQRLVLPLKTKPMLNRWAFRTTNVLYNLLYNDLYAIGANQSLVRGTRRYFGAIDPNQIETYCQGYPLRLLQQVLHDGIGPLGNIDIKWLPAPRSLIRAVGLFHANLTEQLLTTASITGMLGRETLYPRPLRWKDTTIHFITGNPMCTFGGPMPFVQQTLGFDDVCGAQAPLTLEWHVYNALFALVLYETHPSTACAPFVDDSACRRLVADAMALQSTLRLSMPPPIWIDDVAAYNVGLFQILMRNTSTVELDLQPLLSPDFAFLGAMYLYDWARNQREVVQIQGDVASFTLMSSLYLPLPRTKDDAAAPRSLGPYLSFLAIITSATLVITGGLLLCVGWRTRGAQPHDWWSFVPLTASGWVSRNLLVLRSVAAILCLAAVPLGTTTTTSGFARLVEGPRSIVVSSVLALESLWLLLVAHNVLLPLQRSDITTSPLHAFFGWCTILALDQLAPPTLAASLDRECYSVNMDSMVYCTSGVVHVGSFPRVLVLLSIAAFFICTSLFMALCRCASNVEMLRPNAILPLLSPWRVTPVGHAVSATAAVMCGLLPLRWRGRCYLFDIKLWLLLRADDHVFDDDADGAIVLFFSATPRTVSQGSGPLTLKHSSWERLVRVAGVVYIGFTLWSNTAYLGVLQNSLANDLGWAGFNATGMHAFLSNTFNAQLLTAVDAPVLLHDASFADPLQPYNSSSTTVAWYPTLARRYLLSTAPPLDDLVAGLRAMDPCQLPWMFTQYCWLDLGQRWEMASTHSRQARCSGHVANGALYLETSLRNVRDWARWRFCWGDSFDIGFGRYLDMFEAGRFWLDAIARPQALSVSEEVVHWRAHGITQFVLQWQNFKDTGLDDAMVISSALGLSYSLPISQRAGVLHLDRQTSHRFYWAFASDLWAVSTNTTSTGGRSLLRQSPDFAFANATRASLLFENLTLSSPLPVGLHLLNAAIGPFGVIDMIHINCPRSLLDFFDAVRRSIATETTTNLQAQRQLLTLPAKPYIGHVPISLLNDPDVGIVGGDLTCGNDIQVSPPSGALYALFGADSLCSWWHLEYFTPSTLGLLFALSGFDAVHTMQPETDLAAFCARDVYAEAACVTIYNASYNLATSSLCRLTASLRSLATAAESEARALGIQTVQYLVKPYNGASVQLYQINILDASDRSWVFFGWNYLAEWVVGLREVVSFKGDAGAITAISKQSKPMTLSIDDAGIPTRLSFVCQQCVRYVTATIMLGATVAALYALFVCRGAYEGANLFALNRLVGHAWVGRALLIVRGVTALWLLNTQPLELTAVGAGARFAAPPLAIVPTLLGASELSWLVYIMNDILSCVTRQYTPFYAWKSSVAASAIAAAWTLAVPQDYTASVRRRCTFVDMDLALNCISGHVVIGRVSRVLVDVALCVTCVVGAAIVERLLSPTLPPARITSLFLNATSLYSSNLSYWAVGDDQYTDRMSAAMGGLLTWRYRGDMHLFDIKSWRYFVVAPETTCPFPTAAVLPLHRIR